MAIIHYNYRFVHKFIKFRWRITNVLSLFWWILKKYIFEMLGMATIRYWKWLNILGFFQLKCWQVAVNVVCNYSDLLSFAAVLLPFVTSSTPIPTPLVILYHIIYRMPDRHVFKSWITTACYLGTWKIWAIFFAVCALLFPTHTAYKTILVGPILQDTRGSYKSWIILWHFCNHCVWQHNLKLDLSWTLIAYLVPILHHTWSLKIFNLQSLTSLQSYVSDNTT